MHGALAPKAVTNRYSSVSAFPAAVVGNVSTVH